MKKLLILMVAVISISSCQEEKTMDADVALKLAAAAYKSGYAKGALAALSTHNIYESLRVDSIEFERTCLDNIRNSFNQ